MVFSKPTTCGAVGKEERQSPLGEPGVPPGKGQDAAASLKLGGQGGKEGEALRNDLELLSRTRSAGGRLEEGWGGEEGWEQH